MGHGKRKKTLGTTGQQERTPDRCVVSGSREGASGEHYRERQPPVQWSCEHWTRFEAEKGENGGTCYHLYSKEIAADVQELYQKGERGPAFGRFSGFGGGRAPCHRVGDNWTGDRLHLYTNETTACIQELKPQRKRGQAFGGFSRCGGGCAPRHRTPHDGRARDD